MQKVTMADVAKEAGVSKSTVSQYLNKRYEYMSAQTKENIGEAIEKLGYRPNILARGLKQKRTSMIGVIVANIMNRFSTEVSRSIEDYFYQYDFQAIVCNADDDAEKEKNYIEMLRAKQVDGLIIFPTGKNLELYRQMVNEKYPVVFMDRKIENLDATFVLTNNVEASSDAVHQFIRKGHERIAIVTQPLTISPRIDRINGYKKALHGYGIPLNPNYMIHTDIHNIKDALLHLFQLPKPPTVLLAGNDLVFLEVLEFAQLNKIKIPEQLSLVVFDHVPFAHLVNPTISTIAQPSFEMGKKAAQILLEKINKEVNEQIEYTFPCQFIDRDSTIL
ncbi:LacI family DNA-binding transcriptional regulator [Bacillus sp. 03113]|uniref:LacI family DNA-binding transcriptional regulator n=1 Tax=Bacillus sp. 03113 TaxID=2578211 RepID=UPI00114189CF|nr:substrate-binding domain-containing protein [Bacillus sp. 03113]